MLNYSYLDRKKVVGGDEAAYEYRWGSRAEKELTKRQVLQFVSEVSEKFIFFYSCIESIHVGIWKGNVE